MNSGRIAVFIVLLLFGFVDKVQAQVPEYNMADSTVTDCAGVLYDSGGLGQIYENNEVYTFTVETEGPITITFLNEFCLDGGFDFLSVYDGPDTGAPLLGTFTGTTLPPTLVALSGSVTFYFTSDENAAYCGWHIGWSTEVTPPDEPIFTVVDPGCGDVLNLSFSDTLDIPTWAMEDATITVFGIAEHDIDDIAISGSEIVTEVTLTLDDPIEFNCDYSIELDIYLPDQCDSLWHYTVLEEFQVEDCPFYGNLVVENDSLCLGDCMDIFIDVPSSQCYTYTFDWNNGLPATAGPHLICPEETTTYTCLVTELETGNTFIEGITIEVIDGGTTEEDFVLCATSEAFNLNIDDLDAYWTGDGIIDELTGLFDPDSAQVGNNTLYYISSNLCVDSIVAAILPINAGGTIAACPGTDPFSLEPFPMGGDWTGPYVTTEGIFDPSVEGSYQLFYDLNGCLDTLTVNVEELVSITDLGVRCQSDYEEYIPFEPFGGTWSGPGIVDSLFGCFDPGEMPDGNQQFYYEMYGCDQVVNIEILPIYVGSHWRNSCPSQEPYVPFSGWSPTGGYWEGNGIIDPDNFIYDPGLLADGEWSNLIYNAPNGCTDTIYMFNRTTSLGPDTMRFCIEDEDYFLDFETIGRTPWGGTWDGGYFYAIEDDGEYFSPSLTGVGEHMITYSNNGCTDSLLMLIYPAEIDVDTLEFCSNDAIYELFPDLPGGSTWSGPGITDSSLGLFDPSLPSDDDFYIYWNTFTSCTDSVFIYIEEFEPATISDLDSIYCFENQDYEIGLWPDGGTLTGLNSTDVFNPMVEGEGNHTMVYEYTTALCASSDTASVFVYPEILGELTTQDSVLCPGESTLLSVSSIGGDPNELYSYQWTEGLFPIDNNTVFPESTTTYYVEIHDGCSDPAIDSITVEVLPPIEVDISMNDTVCYGLDGYATAAVNTEGDFITAWGYNSDNFSDTLFTYAGNSTQLLVTDQLNGCSFDTILFTPSYTPIAALFSVNPNEDCIPAEFNPVSFIDLSEHGITGSWDFGNGQTQAYVPDQNPSMNYDAGNYTTTLIIQNEGNCADTASIDICVLPFSRLFIPDIFSPNGDLNNDVFLVRGQGIVEMGLRIYDQWGELVFESNDPEVGWDGNFNDKEMPSGVYIYQALISLNNGERLQLNGDITLIR